MIWIDGIQYDLVLEAPKRGLEKEYKYDLITESGHRRRELRAAYRTYEIQLGSLDQVQYDSLHKLLSFDDNPHEVSFPDGQENITMMATVDLGEDEIMTVERDGTVCWTGMTLSIVGIDPLGGAV